MTEKQILKWIKDNLGDAIQAAINGTSFTEDWLAGMCMRETGFLIDRYVARKYKPEQIHPLMRGDYGQRPGETEKQYHGFGYWQIDTGSYLSWIKTGAWKDPYKTCLKAVSVLEEKRLYLLIKLPTLAGIKLEDAITAAYNCGQGNVVKALKAGLDVDRYTHQKNYSKEVRRFRVIYAAL